MTPPETRKARSRQASEPNRRRIKGALLPEGPRSLAHPDRTERQPTRSPVEQTRRTTDAEHHTQGSCTDTPAAPETPPDPPSSPATDPHQDDPDPHRHHPSEPAPQAPYDTHTPTPAAPAPAADPHPYHPTQTPPTPRHPDTTTRQTTLRPHARKRAHRAREKEICARRRRKNLAPLIVRDRARRAARAVADAPSTLPNRQPSTG